MHTFQTYPSDMFEIDPFTKIGSEWMLITSGNREKANALTASWGGLGFLWGKNVAFIFIRKSRYTKEFIDNGETFSMTFFDKKYKNDLKYFGAVSGRQEDKFKTSGLNLMKEILHLSVKKWRLFQSPKICLSTWTLMKNGTPRQIWMTITPCILVRSQTSLPAKKNIFDV